MQQRLVHRPDGESAAAAATPRMEQRGHRALINGGASEPELRRALSGASGDLSITGLGCSVAPRREKNRMNVEAGGEEPKNEEMDSPQQLIRNQPPP